MDFTKTNPQALEKYRVKSNLTASELSEKMGKTPGWYSRIRNGLYPLRMNYIPQMAEIFGIKPERLAKEYYSSPKLEDTSSSEETNTA
ncbi:Helix-turn-helix domain protein [compost metagenome]